MEGKEIGMIVVTLILVAWNIRLIRFCIHAKNTSTKSMLTIAGVTIAILLICKSVVARTYTLTMSGIPISSYPGPGLYHLESMLVYEVAYLCAIILTSIGCLRIIGQLIDTWRSRHE